MTTIQAFLEARIALPLSWSHDGDRLLVASNLPGTMQLFEWRGDGDGALRQLTVEPEPVTGRYLPVSDQVLVCRDAGGNEREQLYLLDPDGCLAPLVVDDRYLHVPGGATTDGTRLAYRTNRRNGVDFDVVVRHLASGHETVLYDRGGFNAAGAFSPDGSWLAVVQTTERSGDNELFLAGVDTGELVRVHPHDEPAELGPPAWLADGSGFFFTTDLGRDVAGVARYELAGRRAEVVHEPGWECEVHTDRAGHHLLVACNEEGWTRAELRDPTTLERTCEVPLPGRGVAEAWTFSRDGRRLAFHFSSASVPGDVWSFDTTTGGLVRLTTSPSTVDPSLVSVPELHRFVSFDGESIPAFLYRPPASHRPPRTGADAPVVAVLHGGPESQARPRWNPVNAYLTASGYAVVTPNVRGSTGYGRRYEHLDDQRRRLDAVADLAALHDWLASVDGLDAGRAALYGGSYGGYLVLAGLTFQPERWAAGVDIVGISSLVTFLERTSPYRRRVREREYGSLATDRDFLLAASPLTHLEHLSAPLFVIHGANDPRVPLSEAEQLHAHLASRGVRTELLVYPDEGHGLQKLANRLDAYPRVVAFLDEVLRPAPKQGL